MRDPTREIYSKSILDIWASRSVCDNRTDTLLKHHLQLPSLKVCHQLLRLCGGRTVTKPTTQSARVLERVTPGPEHAHGEIARERGRPGQRLAFLPSGVRSRGRGEGMSGAPCRCQILATPIRAGKLKTCKTGKLTSRPVTRATRISDFQDFRFSPTLATPKSCRLNPDGGMGWGIS